MLRAQLRPDEMCIRDSQNMSVVNRKAMEGTILDHTDGGVPEVVIEVDDLSAYDVEMCIRDRARTSPRSPSTLP